MSLFLSLGLSSCTKHVCFLPGVWRTRLMLSYEKIPHKTIFLDFPDIEPALNRLTPSPLPAFSELGYDIERQINEACCLAFRKPIKPSVHTILPQRTLEAMFKGLAKRRGPTHSAVDMEENTDVLKDKMCDLMEVLLSHQNSRPFLMGTQPCYTDFLPVGILACAKVVDEEIFKRLAKSLCLASHMTPASR
ncbi:hypothetical protein N7494_007666 [Penicillium frequentans]|uniref:GST C-terminal domain-containing protein n=1 Tax=Penicillium frequentans TaxID=3151616 RepID=A0AAD6CSX9_9EURO|nr:hypothetical protein N7494_007666 [Penicillium glabrum]